MSLNCTKILHLYAPETADLFSYANENYATNCPKIIQNHSLATLSLWQFQTSVIASNPTQINFKVFFPKFREGKQF